MQDLILKVAPPILAHIVKGLMSTVRVVEVWGREGLKEVIIGARGKVIYATWHQRMSYHFHHLGGKNISVLISPSRDGELAARLAERLGFRPVRGSSSREGFRGLMGMVKELKAGNAAGMLADGPLGPARLAKIGTVVMASLAEAPIIPVTWGVDRCWILNSWDRYMIPKPFSRAVISYGRPIWVPKGKRGQELERYRVLLEETLNELTRQCDMFFGQVRPKAKGE